MVAGVDDKRVVLDTGFGKRLEHAADVVVEKRHHAVVSGDGDPDMIRVAEVVLIVLDLAQLS